MTQDSGGSWHYFTSAGEQAGPVSEETIRDMIRRGVLTRKELAWTDGMGDWTELGKLNEFSGFFAASSSATRPTSGNITLKNTPSSSGSTSSSASRSSRAERTDKSDVRLYRKADSSNPYSSPSSDLNDLDDIEAVYDGEPEPHPWIRWFARHMDTVLVYLPIAVVIGILSEVIGFDIEMIPDIVLGLIMLVVGACTVEPLLISVANTPGKAILGIKVRTKTGERLPFITAVKRTVLMTFAGLGLGIGIVGLICHVMSFKRLNEKGETFWDEACETVTLHKPLTALRIVLYIGVFAAIFGIIFMAVSYFTDGLYY